VVKLFGKKISLRKKPTSSTTQSSLSGTGSSLGMGTSTSATSIATSAGISTPGSKETPSAPIRTTSGGGGSPALDTTTTKTEEDKTITVTPSGKVFVEGKSFTGGAHVPGAEGLTAREVFRFTSRVALQQGFESGEKVTARFSPEIFSSGGFLSKPSGGGELAGGSPPPSQVGLVEEQEGFGETRSLGGGLKDVGLGFLSRFGSPGSDRTAFKDILDPLEDVGTRKGDRPAIVGPDFLGRPSIREADKVSPIDLFRAERVTTFGEIAKERAGSRQEIISASEKDLTSQLEIGSITQEKAQEDFLGVQQSAFEQFPPIDTGTTRTKGTVKEIVSLAALLTGVGSAIGLGAAASESPQILRDGILGTTFTTEEAIFAGGVGLSAGARAFGKFRPNVVEREIAISQAEKELEILGQKEFGVDILQITKRGKGRPDVIEGVLGRQTDKLSEEIIFRGGVTKEGKVSVVNVIGESKVKGEIPFDVFQATKFEQRPTGIIQVTEFEAGSRGIGVKAGKVDVGLAIEQQTSKGLARAEFQFGQKEAFINVGKDTFLPQVRGSSFFQLPKKSTEKFLVSGTTEITGTPTLGVGVQGTQFRIDKGFTVRKGRGGTGVTLINEAPVKQIDLFQVGEVSKDFGIKLTKKQTPFSKTFGVQQQIITQEVLPDISTTVQKGLTTKTFKTPSITSTNLIGIPRATGGGGLTEIQIARGQGAVVQTKIQPDIITQVPRQQFGIGREFKTEFGSGIKTDFGTGIKLTPRTDFGIKSVGRNKPETKTFQSLFQPQGLTQDAGQLLDLGQPQAQRLRQPQKLEQLIQPITTTQPKGGFGDFGFRGGGGGFGLPPFFPKGAGSFFGGETRVGKRTFQRTPSFGAIVGAEFGFKAPKRSKALEQSGLVERPFEGQVELGPLTGKVTRRRKKII